MRCLPISLWFAAAALAQQVSEVQFGAGHSFLLTLTPAAPDTTKPFALDPADAVDISVVGSSRTLEVSLIDPAGTVHIAGATDLVVTDSYAGPPTDDAKVANYEFVLSTPPPGIWNLRVRETAPFTGLRFALFRLSGNSELVSGLLGT